MKVVLTAPIPGVKMPSFPLGGATLAGLRILFPQSNFSEFYGAQFVSHVTTAARARKPQRIEPRCRRGEMR
jgi:hypothetical protein